MHLPMKTRRFNAKTFLEATSVRGSKTNHTRKRFQDLRQSKFAGVFDDVSGE